MSADRPDWSTDRPDGSADRPVGSADRPDLLMPIAHSANSAATPGQPRLQTEPPPGGLVQLWLPSIQKLEESS